MSHSASSSSGARSAGEGGKIALCGLQAEAMSQQGGLQAEQGGSLLTTGGEGAGQAGIHPKACSGLSGVQWVLCTARRQAGRFAHPEQMAA